MHLSKCVKLAYKQFLNLDRMRFCDKAASFLPSPDHFQEVTRANCKSLTQCRKNICQKKPKYRYIRNACVNATKHIAP